MTPARNLLKLSASARAALGVLRNTTAACAVSKGQVAYLLAGRFSASTVRHSVLALERVELARPAGRRGRETFYTTR